MSMPAVGDQAPEVALEDQSGAVHRLSDQRRPVDDPLLLPQGRHARLHRRGVRVPRRQRHDRRAGRGRLGRQPAGRAPASARSREKFGLPFTLLADVDHRVAEAYGSWVEKENYGKKYWGTARTTFLVGPDGRIARVWPKVKPEGHAAEVLAALDEEQAVRVG